MEVININITNAPENPAEKWYKNHLKNVAKYQKNNPEKMREKAKKYLANIKENDPEKYKENLEKKRMYYHQVRKPKLQSTKEQKPENPEI